MRKRIIASTVILIVVALLSVSTLSYAWLTRNKELESQGQKMQIEAQGVITESYKVYRYNNDTNHIDDITTDTNIYEMAAYDSIFTERNVNTPLLYEISLRNVPDVATMITVRLECSESTYTRVTNAGGFTSNIVYSECASLSTINVWANSNGYSPVSAGYSDQADRDDKFDTIVSYFNSVGTETKFVTSLSPSPVKSSVMEYNITATGDAQGKAVVYLIIDYDQELVSDQGIFEFGNIDISSQTIDLFRQYVPFVNDIVKITFDNT